MRRGQQVRAGLSQQVRRIKRQEEQERAYRHEVFEKREQTQVLGMAEHVGGER